MRTDPYDESAMQDTIPLHRIMGPAAWFAPMCPGSMVWVPLRPVDREFIEGAERTYQVAKERSERGESIAGPIWNAPPGYHYEWELTDRSLGDDPHPCPFCELMFPARFEVIVHIAKDHDTDVRPDWSRPPGGDINSYFPVRPAESEADEGDEIEETTQSPNGKVVMQGNSDRSGLKGILAMVAQSSGEAQEACAKITNHLEAVTGLVEVVTTKHQAAAALAVAGVGDDDGTLPDPAHNMLAAASRLGQIINDLRNALSTAQARNDAAFRSSGRVASEAQAYARMI